jgi:hypothetical protein
MDRLLFLSARLLEYGVEWRLGGQPPGWVPAVMPEIAWRWWAAK